MKGPPPAHVRRRRPLSDAPLHESSIASLDLIGRGKVRAGLPLDEE